MKRPEPARKPTLHELVDIEVRILDRICRDGPYTSPVMLAADEWRGNADWLMASVDTVMWVLYGLNDQGLVVIREKKHADGETWGIPITYIRATPLAFDLLDFRSPIRVVGEWPQHPETPLKRADMTEFRNHAEQAEPSPIERMDIHQHLDIYPDHRFNKTGW
jgi:hypothetical protein